MVLRNVLRLVVKRRTLGIAFLILAFGAGTALAVTLTMSQDGTLVGSSAGDSLSATNQANVTIWGLAGADTINGGDGNDVIDGDGHCQAGVSAGAYPHGLPPGKYCEHGRQSGDGGDKITAGNGDDVVYGGGGHNTISLGGGNDTIYGGPLGDTITAGLSSQGDDKIWLGKGTSYTGSTVKTGSGNDVIHAQNGVKDTISCQSRNGTTVYADKGKDVITGCAHVVYTTDPNPGPAGDVGAQRTSHKHKAARHHRSHKKSKKKGKSYRF